MVNALRCTCGKRCFRPGAEIEEILKRQVGMQSADNVELRDRLGVSGSRGLERFFESHGVGAGRIFLAAKSAQSAGRHTNIRRIDDAG